MLQYLDFGQYEANAQRFERWRSYRSRWQYHDRAVEVVRELGIGAPEEVLEIGPYGAQLVQGSHVMDLPDGDWNHDGRVRYRHDARILPWPVPDGFYRLVVALRVWHHLYPRQRECFMEALRISDHVLIVCPEKEVVGKGIPAEDWHLWHGGPPLIEDRIGAWGVLYLWRKP